MKDLALNLNPAQAKKLFALSKRADKAKARATEAHRSFIARKNEAKNAEAELVNYLKELGLLPQPEPQIQSHHTEATSTAPGNAAEEWANICEEDAQQDADLQRMTDCANA